LAHQRGAIRNCDWILANPAAGRTSIDSQSRRVEDKEE
jgi:hypothetical protein